MGVVEQIMNHLYCEYVVIKANVLDIQKYISILIIILLSVLYVCVCIYIYMYIKHVYNKYALAWKKKDADHTAMIGELKL